MPWKRTILVLVLAASVFSCGSSPGSNATPSSSPSTPAAPGSTTAAATATTNPTRARPPERSAGCASPTSPITKGHATDEATTSSGVGRTFKRFVPTSYDGANPMPLVIDLHGYVEGAALHGALSNLNRTAETRGFVNLTPQGTGELPYWNAAPIADAPDDVQFMSDLIDLAGQQLCVDLTRVYATGLSNGAFMSSLLACRLSEKVAAVAPVAGLMRPHDCRPTRAMPIAAFHGTGDPLVKYASDDSGPNAPGNSLPFTDETRKVFVAVNFQAIPKALQQWAEAEGCATTPTEKTVSPSVTLISYSGCRDVSTVELYRVEGGGHTWPGSAGMASIENIMGKTTTEIDANELMWQFFQHHRL